MLVICPGNRNELDDFDLDPVITAELWRMEDRHFWHAARNRWIEQALLHYGVAPPARVLGVGCGSGSVSSTLSRRGYALVGVDTAEVLVRKAHERVPHATFIVGSVAQLDPGL